MDVNEIIKAKKNRQLSDDEIVKTLICCQECNCKDCPKYISELGRCMGPLDSDEILGLIQRQKAQIEELTNKHWQECGQISQYANGVPINLPCEVGATVYMVIIKKMKGMKKPIQQIERGIVDHFTIGDAGIPVAEICLESGIWCTSCEPGEYYLTLEDAQEELDGKTEEQKKRKQV